MTVENATDRTPRRHDLAWPLTWPESLPEAARDWLTAGRPAVVCRRETTRGENLDIPPPVRLGLALPPLSGLATKPGRCAWETERRELLRLRSPLTLRETLPAAPDAWRPALEVFCRDGKASALEWRVFGSLAWQALGHGEFTFLAPDRSDLDLLVTPTDPAQLDVALALLHAADCPPLRLDGEILFPDDWAVSWREWATNPRQVLAKRTDVVALRPPAELRETLTRPVHPTPLRLRAPA